MPHERDLFANFERMRREMDELFGDVFDRRLSPRRRAGFSPSVDVYYLDDPPRAVVKADLAGIDPDDLDLEIRGRELVLAGLRRPDEAEGRVYQQVEIEHGTFRRVLQLGVEVDAEAAKALYQDGMLVVELPVLASEPASRTVPITKPGSTDTRGESTSDARAGGTNHRPSSKWPTTKMLGRSPLERASDADSSTGHRWIQAQSREDPSA